MQQLYFQRLWVLQEIYFSRKVTCLIGKNTLDWDVIIALALETPQNKLMASNAASKALLSIPTTYRISVPGEVPWATQANRPSGRPEHRRGFRTSSASWQRLENQEYHPYLISLAGPGVFKLVIPEIRSLRCSILQAIDISSLSPTTLPQWTKFTVAMLHALQRKVKGIRYCPVLVFVFHQRLGLAGSPDGQIKPTSSAFSLIPLSEQVAPYSDPRRAWLLAHFGLKLLLST